MFFRSLRVKLYLILALLAAILGLMLTNHIADKKEAELEFVYSHIVELDNKWSSNVSRESRLFFRPDGLARLTETYIFLDRSCLECHAKKTDLIEQRRVILSNLADNMANIKRQKNEIKHILHELADNIKYLHENLVDFLEDFLQHDTMQVESPRIIASSENTVQDTVRKTSILSQIITIQHYLTILASNYYSINYYSIDSSYDLLKFESELKMNITSLFKAASTLSNNSQDARHKLLAEKVLKGSRALERLSTEFIGQEKQYRILIKSLSDNHKALSTTLSELEEKIRTKRNNLKDRITLLKEGSFLSVFFLTFIISLISREIINSINEVIEETKKIHNNISYRIQDNPNVAPEFQVVFHTLNSMTENIELKTRKLHEEIAVRIKAEQELNTQKERLSVTLHAIDDGVISTDLHGNIILTNKVAENLTGWSHAETSGFPLAELFRIIDKKTEEPCESPVSKVIKLGKSTGPINHTILLAKDGARREIAYTASPIHDLENNIIGIVVIFRDVTTESKMKEEALKLKKLQSVGVLAAGIAHDFNNILAAILGNINLAGLFLSPTDKAYPLLQEAEKASLRAKKLTQQLLTFSKGGEPVRTTTSIATLIRDSAEIILRKSSVTCQYQISKELWLTSIDPDQISQVIQNLVLNACQATPSGGTIYITCVNIAANSEETSFNIKNGKYIKVTIEDNGIGIPEDVIDNVFDPFFTTKEKGSGLGLAVAYSIIKKHDGYISIKSTHEKGTISTFYIPATGSGSQNSENKSHGGHKMHDKRKILVMDDEKMMLQVITRMLTHLGYDVVSASDGAEVVSQYKRLLDTNNKISAIIMDLTVPGGMGGLEAAQAILTINPKTKVIAASGYSSDPVMAHYQEYGFSAAITKPFNLSDLNNTLHSVLKK